MGYELTRFQGEVDEELICPICSGVLEEPVQVRLFLLYFFFKLIFFFDCLRFAILCRNDTYVDRLSVVLYLYLFNILLIYRQLFVNMRFVALALRSGYRDSPPARLTEML